MEDLELFIYLLRCSYCEKFWAYLAIETMLFILFYFGSTNTRILVLVRGSGCNNFQSTKFELKFKVIIHCNFVVTNQKDLQLNCRSWPYFNQVTVLHLTDLLIKGSYRGWFSHLNFIKV